jgi:hypothetical protein
MKVYFNRRPVQGPWGGGSKVLCAIIDECKRRQHEVFFEEQIFVEKDLDILFCMDPRPNSLVSYDDLVYARNSNARSKIIQRVGDLGTHGKPDLFDLVKKTSNVSDLLIFPSRWAMESLPTLNQNRRVISNAPLPEFVKKRKSRDEEGTIRIVSHHWSNNSMKGFEVYELLDRYCLTSGERYTFTFIGRKPEVVHLANHVPPQDVSGLVEELPRHHIYVTASRQEAGANHVLEAMGLGLPVLYNRDGGSINEYCKDFGMSYGTFEELIWTLENKQKDLLDFYATKSYTRTSIDMAVDYVNLFESLS